MCKPQVEFNVYMNSYNVLYVQNRVPQNKIGIVRTEFFPLRTVISLKFYAHNVCLNISTSYSVRCRRTSGIKKQPPQGKRMPGLRVKITLGGLIRHPARPIAFTPPLTHHTESEQTLILEIRINIRHQGLRVKR